MFLKKFLKQPNGVGSVLIALLFCAGVLFAFGFNGFNMGTTTDGDAEALLHMSMSGNCGGGGDDDDDDFVCECLTDEAGNKLQSSPAGIGPSSYLYQPKLRE